MYKKSRQCCLSVRVHENGLMHLCVFMVVRVYMCACIVCVCVYVCVQVCVPCVCVCMHVSPWQLFFPKTCSPPSLQHTPHLSVKVTTSGNTKGTNNQLCPQIASC